MNATFHNVLSETFKNTGTKETIDIDNTIVNLKASSSFKREILEFVADMQSKYSVHFTIHCIGDLSAELETIEPPDANNGSENVKLCIPMFDYLPLKLFIYSSTRLLE